MKNWVCKITLKEAVKSSYKQFKHSAVIEKGGSIISKGTNSLKAIDPGSNFPYSTHAEVAAIQDAEADINGAILYSARVTTTRIALAKPCEKCMLQIIASGIKKVVYSIDNQSWGVIAIP